MKWIVLPMVLACAGGAWVVRADVVHLKDGSRLEGDVKRSEDGWVVNSHGVAIAVRAEQVQSIELSPSASTRPAGAAERLASLRRSVENSGDLKEIISRYQRFIDQNSDPNSTAEAKKDLAVWQDRMNQTMVKVGNKWVLPGDRSKLMDTAVGLAEQGRQFMKQGRTKEAEPLLVEAISDDPQNPSALYLLGLLRYQQEQIPAARKALEQVAMEVPNHAPTLNNLAVVQWRQRQFVAALASYDGAMLAAPVNKEILDNVASALQSLPAEFRNSAITQKTTRHFNEQDKTLAEQMAQEGWHRYGATWVTDKEMDQIQKQEKETQQKLDAMSTEFDQCKDRVDQLDRSIADSQTEMRRIEASSFYRDPASNNIVQLPLPSIYYDMQRDVQRQQRDRQIQTSKMDSLKKSAQALQKTVPSQRTVDVQKMVGPEGTPMRVPEKIPTTAPATQRSENGGQPVETAGHQAG